MPKELIKHLINIVDTYLDEEERHYEEEINYNDEEAKLEDNFNSNNHIFHDLLAVSYWIKENHTMKEMK